MSGGGCVCSRTTRVSPAMTSTWSLVLGGECLCVGCHYLIEGEDSGTRGTVILRIESYALDSSHKIQQIVTKKIFSSDSGVTKN